MIRPAMPERISERLLVFLVAAVQFVNILDFMMVMPLGPDFSTALHIPTSKLGLLGGSYTAAAAIAGLVGSTFLDRFDRRRALALAMLGLVTGTVSGGFATGLPSMVAARVVAGMFGGPASALSMSIVTDAVPVERRGKAIGAVMGSFSAASVLGVPAGLELARLGGWRLPFFAVGGVALVLTLFVYLRLPPQRAHLETRSASQPRFRELFDRPTLLYSYAMALTVMMSGFVLIPNIATFLLKNLGYPRARLGILYLFGGIASFLAMRVAGRLVDRFGAFRIGTLASALLVVVLWFGFAHYQPWTPIVVIFVSFMLVMSIRGVSFNTLASRVPRPEERASFMSVLSSVQHMGAALGAFASTRLLRELPGGALEGIPRVAALSMALVAVLPVLLWIVEARVRVPAATT
jgi:predicted MFS family arabinose efflux permease